MHGIVHGPVTLEGSPNDKLANLHVICNVHLQEPYDLPYCMWNVCDLIPCDLEPDDFETISYHKATNALPRTYIA